MSRHRRTDPGSSSAPPRYPGSFLLAFREAAARIGWQLDRLIQDVARCVDDERQEHVVGVENLYRRARQTPREHWPELIAEFLQTIRSAEKGEHLPADLASVVDRLLLRLGQPLKPESGASPVWAQPLEGTDLVVNLVIDYPNRMCYVTEQLVQLSGRPGGDWLAQAQANLLARTPADCFQIVHEASGMRICSVADAYDSSRALLLDTLLPETRAEGVLVVVPGRDELLVLPVCRKSVPHLHLMKVLAERDYKNAPYPISDEVYWVRQGVWRRFAIEIKSDEITVQPPPEFVDILKRLTSDEV